MKDFHCIHCDTWHPLMAPCAKPVLDPFQPKEDTVSERPGYFRGAKISKPVNRGQKS